MPHLLYPFLCQWKLGCFHVLAIVNSVTVIIGVHVYLNYSFCWIYAQEWDCRISYYY